MRGTTETVGLVSQLTGLNALELISMIGKAADSARMHKRKCDKFAQWLTLVESAVRPLMMDPALMEIGGGARDTLEQLEGALRRAWVLVDSCKDKSCLYLLPMGCIFARQLKQSKAEIAEMLILIPIAAIPRQNAVTCTTKDAAIEGFKQLLEEASQDITAKTKYKNFAKKWGHDQRFRDLDRKGREQLLKERVVTLKKDQEKEVNDKHVAADSNFKDMLRNRGDINSRSHWSGVQQNLRNDSRYKEVKKGRRKDLFSEFLDEMRATEQETESAGKAKRENELASSKGVHMHKVLSIMAYPLQKIFNYQPVCVRDGSQCPHQN